MGAGDVEPTEQLRQIQEMLADVEQEFCPAGSIGPEVELVFDDPAHPFQEPFQQEEVIRDRYAGSANVAGGSAVPDAPAGWPGRRRRRLPAPCEYVETDPTQHSRRRGRSDCGVANDASRGDRSQGRREKTERRRRRQRRRADPHHRAPSRHSVIPAAYSPSSRQG